MKLNRNKALAMLASFLILTTAIGVGVWSVGFPDTVTVRPESVLKNASFNVGFDGIYYYAINGSTGEMLLRSTNKVTVINACIANLTVSGGSIYLNQLTQGLVAPYGSNILIIEDIAGSIAYFSNGKMIYSASDGILDLDLYTELNSKWYFWNYLNRTDTLAYPVVTASYTVFMVGSTVCMKNGSTGQIDYSSTNASKVIEFAIGNCSGGSVAIKAGTYSDLNVTAKNVNVTLIGEGLGATILVPKANCFALNFFEPTAPKVYDTRGYTVSVRDLSILSTATNSSGIYLSCVNYGLIENVEANVTGTGFANYRGNNNRWSHCVALNCTTGFYSVGGYYGVSTGSIPIDTAAGLWAPDMWYDNCFVYGCNYGFYMDDSTNGWQIKGCGVEYADIAAFYICGSWSGGWASDTWAASGAGYGWYLTNSLMHYVDNIQLINVWGSDMDKSGLALVNTNSTIPILRTQVANSAFNYNGEYGVYMDGTIQVANIVHCVLSGNPVDFRFSSAGSLSTLIDIGWNQLSGSTIAYDPYVPPSFAKVHDNIGNTFYQAAAPNEDVSGYSYMVYTDGSSYFMRNGSTGRIDFSSTNASAVINNAIGNMTYGGTVFVKAGNYSIIAPIILYGTGASVGITIRGEGGAFASTTGYIQNTVFRLADSTNVDIFKSHANVDTATNAKWGVKLENFAIDGNTAANSAGNGIHGVFARLEVHDVSIYNFAEDGVNLTLGSASGGDSFYNRFSGVTSNNNDVNGFEVNTGVVDTIIQDFCHASGNGGWGALIEEGMLTLTDSCWYSNALGNVRFNGWGAKISNNEFDWTTATKTDLYIAGSQVTIAGNHFLGHLASYNNIVLDSAKNCSITGNQFRAGARYCINVYAGNDTVITDNVFEQTTSTPVFQDGSPEGLIIHDNVGFVTENTILNAKNTTATTFVFNHGLASTANSVQVSFNFTGWTSWTWTSTTTQVTVTVTGTLPAAMKILAADCKYIP